MTLLRSRVALGRPSVWAVQARARALPGYYFWKTFWRLFWSEKPLGLLAQGSNLGLSAPKFSFASKEAAAQFRRWLFTLTLLARVGRLSFCLGHCILLLKFGEPGASLFEYLHVLNI